MMNIHFTQTLISGLHKTPDEKKNFRNIPSLHISLKLGASLLNKLITVALNSIL